jgi:hypothetical protein
MDAGKVWREFFEKWPKDVPRQGVLVTNQDEQVPFVGFMTSESMVLFERRTPDTVGARKVILPYEYVAAIKLVDVVKAKTLQAAGWSGELPHQ